MDLSYLQQFKRNKKNKVLVSSSESEDEALKFLKPQVQYNVLEEEDIPNVSEIEASLARLSEMFPDKDELELQDALSNLNWSIEDAVHHLTSSTKKKNRKRIRMLSSSTDEEKVLSPVKDRKRKRLVVKKPERNCDEDSEPDFVGTGLSVYDSEDSDFEISDTMNASQKEVFHLLSCGIEEELLCMKNCSAKKVEAILQLRPFTGWIDLVIKLKEHKFLSTDILNSAQELINMRKVVKNLMKHCEQISNKLENNVNALLDGTSKSALSEQPKSIRSGLKLSPYQMIGLNWLILLNKENINGVLADEMGLGKTVQAIAFLAHLFDVGCKGPHVIVVPSSTLDNWERELNKWCPDLKVIPYCGPQEDRVYCRNYRLLKEEYHVILTTYSIVSSNPKDRSVFRKLSFDYCIFDEAHLLKNAASQRYRHLMKINSKHKIMLTGTPMQNNLIELMSLLTFIMPQMFGDIQKQLVPTFSLFPNSDEKTKGQFEQERLKQAKNIIRPFFLRREKQEVLRDLPDKEDSMALCPMLLEQNQIYIKSVKQAKEHCQQADKNGSKNVLMLLRKIANHPVLVRDHYQEDVLEEIAQYLAGYPDYKENDPALIVEDLASYSDYEIHSLVSQHKTLSHLALGSQLLFGSGKIQYLDKVIPQMKKAGDRILIFSQFLTILDILELYFASHSMKYCRLDGSTPVSDRQQLIDDYNNNNDIFVFLLSTRAGGLGINLTSANVVIIHDIDFNPYNDKQAEDRCHRVGQTRVVKVIRLVSQDTVEEAMYEVAQQKLKLEKDITSSTDNESKDVALLLQRALTRVT